MKAKIFVTLKNGVLDPQGKTVSHALNALGFPEVRDARVGKFIELDLGDGWSKDSAHEQVTAMCQRLLANPVMENFEIELVD